MAGFAVGLVLAVDGVAAGQGGVADFVVLVGGLVHEAGEGFGFLGVNVDAGAVAGGLQLEVGTVAGAPTEADAGGAEGACDAVAEAHGGFLETGALADIEAKV